MPHATPQQYLSAFEFMGDGRAVLDDLVRLFGVDGIPHLSLISSERKLAGTLVGAVPERVVESSLEALATGKPLPYGASEG
jgi:hypothetical protein